ncbi:unnamed protein product [Rotaria socialis]
MLLDIYGPYEVQCILPQSPTTPERFLSNPYYGKSFCEPDQYKVAINRCEDGFTSCELALEMLKDLVNELERCSKSLQLKTNRVVWLESVKAIEKLAERTDDIADNIKKNVIDELVNYKKFSYDKSFRHVKKAKDEAKVAYHHTSGKLHRAKRAEDITSSDVSSSDEEKNKAKSCVDRYEKEKEKCKNVYAKLINDMESKKSAYQGEMFKILGRADDFERKRLEHFKLMFTALQQVTSIENDTRHTEMLEKFQRAISKHNADSDIEFFNKNYGCETRTKWPDFEDVHQ